MILCIGTTPAAQRVMIFHKLTLDAVNRSATTLEGPAGKSVNVAKVLKALGEHPIATGFLGSRVGEYLRTAMAEKNIESDFVTVSTPTRQCVTVIDESASTSTELVEESRPVDPADFEKLLAVVQKRLKDCRAVIMSGTIVSGGPTDLYFNCTRLAQAAGTLSVVDAHGTALLEALKAKPGVVKPNRSELATTIGRQLATEADVTQAMRELCERGAQQVVVTAGKEPVLAFDGKNLHRITVPRIKAVSTIGSGDAFTAGLVWRLVRGDDLGEACRWGSAAGAANALTAMPGEVNRADVDRLAREVEVTRISQ
jgi:1-phosphofructokinase family hexose kinase